MKTSVSLAIIIAGTLAVCGAFIALVDHDGADLVVYTSDGLSVSVTGDLIGQTVITVDADENVKVDGIFDKQWNRLSDGARYVSYMNNGDTIYVLSKSYSIVQKDEVFDVKELLGTDADGTVSSSRSDYDGAEASIDGTSVTFTSLGLYRMAYVDSETMTGRCFSMLSDGNESVSFTWSYKTSNIPIPSFIKKKLSPSVTGEYSLTLDIQYSDYRHYVDACDVDDRYSYFLNNGDGKENLEHDASFFRYDDVQDQYIQAIADYISDHTSGKSDQYKANVILAFVQNIPYEYDSNTHDVNEYWQYPLETLFLGSGDCEDTSILFCAIAQAMGYETCMFIYEDHAAAGIALDDFTSPSRTSASIDPDHVGWYVVTGQDSEGNDVKTAFYYGETTVPDWLIGEMPRSETSSYKGAILVPDA